MQGEEKPQSPVFTAPGGVPVEVTESESAPPSQDILVDAPESVPGPVAVEEKIPDPEIAPVEVIDDVQQDFVSPANIIEQIEESEPPAPPQEDVLQKIEEPAPVPQEIILEEVEVPSVPEPVAEHEAPPAKKPKSPKKQSPQQVQDDILNWGSAEVRIAGDNYWQARQGESIKKTLASWAYSAHVEFIDAVDMDFQIQQTMNFDGGFEDAVRVLLAQYYGSTVRPVANLYVNPYDSRRVLVLEAVEDVRKPVP